MLQTLFQPFPPSLKEKEYRKCSDFFGLPTYLEMEQLFQEYITKEDNV
jgi:hypothetical protein